MDVSERVAELLRDVRRRLKLAEADADLVSGDERVVYAGQATAEALRGVLAAARGLGLGVG